MSIFTTWNILGVVAIILIFFFFSKGKNAVRGGLSIGLVIGIILGLVYVFKGDGFNWNLFKKSIIVGTLLGGLAELVAMINKQKR